MKRQEEAKATKALWLLLLLAAAGSTYGRYEAVDVDVTFNLDERPISELLDILRGILVNNRPRLIIAGGVFLAPKSQKSGSPPCRWIKLTLVTGGASTTVAISDGDLYLAGFTSIEGIWYCFPEFVNLFPNSQPLPFTESYTDLVHGGHDHLVDIPLGRDPSIGAAKILSDYHPSSTPVIQVKLALARLMITISEALRFKAVRHLITYNWEYLTRLTEHQASRLLMKWGNISECLYLYSKEGVWKDEECVGAKNAGITNAAEAVEEVDLFMRPDEISIDSSIYPTEYSA